MTFTEFSAGITAGHTPFHITSGPDGNLWFTENPGDSIGRITTSGAVTEFSAGITAGAGPFGIVTGSDGAIWFTEFDSSRIGRITTTGTVGEFTVGITPNSNPAVIAAGPDGNLWFTELTANQIGRITPAGVITEFSAGISPGSEPASIAVGPDGNLWFTERAGNRVGRITTAGVVTEFSAGISANAGLNGISKGPDGAVWFVETTGNRIGRITTSGAVTEFSAGITANSGSTGITDAPDGNLWFVETGAGLIGRITPTGVVSEFSQGLTPNSGPFRIQVGPDNNLWFTEINANRIGTFHPDIVTTTAVVTSARTVTFTNSVTFTATVTPATSGGPALTGSVTFLDGSTSLGTVSLSGNTASFTTSSLSSGPRSITASYSGDPAYSGSTSAVLHQLIKPLGFYGIGGAPGRVLAFKYDHTPLADFQPFGSAYTDGISVAVGDVNGDGYADLIVGATVGNPNVRVFDGRSILTGTFDPANPAASMIANWFAYGLNFNVGANVAAGYVDGSQFADIVTGASIGNPHVKVYRGQDIANGTFDPNGASLIQQWFAYGLQFNVGANVAVGDINNDGFADIVTGANVGNPHVKVYNGQTIAHGPFDPNNADAALLAQWFAYALQFDVGAFVAVADTNGDGLADVITGASIGNPQVKVYDGAAITMGTMNASTSESHVLDQFFAFNALGVNLGVTVGAADTNNDGISELFTGATQGPSRYRIVAPNSMGIQPPALFESSPSDLQGGVNVGAF